MTELSVRHFHADDFLHIEAPWQAVELRRGQPLKEWIAEHEVNDAALTVMDPQGNIVFCGGVNPIFKGATGMLWVVFSSCASRYLAVAGLAKKALSKLINHIGYRRLQAVVDPTWDTAVRFTRYLGFHRECTMEAYGPDGRDMDLYALVRHG